MDKVDSPRARATRTSRRRPLAVIGGGAAVLATTLVLSACGGPSAAQSAQQALTAGISAQRAGNYGTATTDYEKVLQTEPKNEYALYDLGDVEQFQHQDAAAAVRYQQVLAIDPKFVNALYNLAIIDTASAPRTAAALYQQVIATYPHDAAARLNLGKVLLSLGERAAGMAQIHVAVQIDPSLRSQAPTS